MKHAKFLLSGIILCAIAFSLSFGQNMKFPQSKTYNSCIKPQYATQHLLNKNISDFYGTWKRKYAKVSTKTPGGYYILCRGTGGNNNHLTVSEAHGFGMVVFALIAGFDPNAQTFFDGMYKFFNSHRSPKNNALMAWAIGKDESIDAQAGDGTATDGDLDIAYAMILAHYQWGSTGAINYLQEAKNMITAIKSAEIKNNRTTLGYPLWTGVTEWDSRPSDWMGDHFRAFGDAAVTGDASWTTVANNIYTMYNTFVGKYSTTTYLITDFIVGQAVDKCPSNFIQEFERTDSYNFNACRVPWRLATDYFHFGNTDAKNICSKIGAWINKAVKGDPRMIGVGYEMNGTTLCDTITSMAFSAPLVTACITDAANQDFLNKGYNVIRYDTTIDMANETAEYESSINLLSMMVITGNWWKPGDANTYVPPPTVTPDGVILDDFENSYGDPSDQTFLGAACGKLKYNDLKKGLGVIEFFTEGKGSSFESPKGTKITKAADAVKSGALQVFLRTTTAKVSPGEWPYAGVVLFLCENDSAIKKYFDFSNLQGISFRCKGSGGMVRFELLTQDIDAAPTDYQWGYYGFNLKMPADWKDTTFPAVYFDQAEYSWADSLGWGWLHGRQKVRGFTISTFDSAIDAEVYIDNIKLNGLDYKTDFGVDGVFLTNDTKAPLVTDFSVLPGVSTRAIPVSYSVKNSGMVKVSLFSVNGRRIANLLNTYVPAGHTRTQILSLQSKGIAKGIYFIRFEADNKVFNKRIDLLR